MRKTSSNTSCYSLKTAPHHLQLATLRLMTCKRRKPLQSISSAMETLSTQSTSQSLRVNFPHKPMMKLCIVLPISLRRLPTSTGSSPNTTWFTRVSQTWMCKTSMGTTQGPFGKRNQQKSWQNYANRNINDAIKSSISATSRFK